MGIFWWLVLTNLHAFSSSRTLVNVRNITVIKRWTRICLHCGLWDNRWTMKSRFLCLAWKKWGNIGDELIYLEDSQFAFRLVMDVSVSCFLSFVDQLQSQSHKINLYSSERIIWCPCGLLLREKAMEKILNIHFVPRCSIVSPMSSTFIDRKSVV